jgi:hypothetical protein
MGLQDLNERLHCRTVLYSSTMHVAAFMLACLLAGFQLGEKVTAAGGSKHAGKQQSRVTRPQLCYFVHYVWGSSIACVRHVWPMTYQCLSHDCVAKGRYWLQINCVLLPSVQGHAVLHRCMSADSAV